MSKILLIIFIFFISTSSYSETVLWEEFDEVHENSLNYWSSKDFKIVHSEQGGDKINSWTRLYLQNTSKDLYDSGLVMCVVNHINFLPVRTFCFFEKWNN